MKFLSCALACLLLLVQVSFADVTVSPQKPIVASPVTIRLDITVPPDSKLGPLDKVSLPEFVNLISLKFNDGADKKEIVLTVESYKTGTIEIPAIEYEVLLHDGSTSKQKTAPISFTVVSVRTDPATADKVKDIRGVAELELNVWSYIWPVLALLALAAFLFFLWRKFSQRDRNMAVAPAVPPLPAHEIAYEKLTRLQAGDLFGKGLVKEHFFSLSEIVREYVEASFNTPALEMTTYELERDLKVMEPALRVQLLSLLKACDVVKFAKGSATREQAESAIRRAFEFVDSTRPAPKEDVA
ncbi:hypothetical protein MNBD_NITROSPINAE01-1359 [hydrothermal vent metagenome]|uniref:BatD n=1 Tax=hydrothermal vent metagenome TaxID=652676 RepID=A0A3B1BX25_9ZZZZ